MVWNMNGQDMCLLRSYMGSCVCRSVMLRQGQWMSLCVVIGSACGCVRFINTCKFVPTM